MQRFCETLCTKNSNLVKKKNHIFIKSCHCQNYQNHEEPPQRFQNPDFQNHFSVLKIGQIFSPFFPFKNIRLGDHVLSNFSLKICMYFNVSIFIDSGDNFGRSEDDRYS